MLNEEQLKKAQAIVDQLDPKELKGTELIIIGDGGTGLAAQVMLLAKEKGINVVMADPTTSIPNLEKNELISFQRLVPFNDTLPIVERVFQEAKKPIDAIAKNNKYGRRNRWR